MNLRDLVIVHGLIGAACAVAVYRQTTSTRRARLASALVTVPLWPLWAPFALASRERSNQSPAVAARIEALLRVVVEAAQGTSLETVLTRSAARHLGAQVRRVAARLAAIDELSSGTGTTARHADAHARLAALRARHADALHEIAELLDALTTQLGLLRLGELPPDAVAETIAEIRSRLDALEPVSGA